MSKKVFNPMKELRLALKLTQKEFGKKLKIHQSHVSKWERQNSLPSGATIGKIAKVFRNVNFNFIFSTNKKQNGSPTIG
jgi:transcriptional regulator with XRE-family HTH domain